MRFTDNNDGTVTDNETGLMWQKVGSDERMTWQEAQDYCASLDLGGHADWRCPTVKELLGIVDYERIYPACDPVFRARSGFHWSSTTLEAGPNNAWGVGFTFGNTSDFTKSIGFYVRAVRAGS